MTYYNSVLIFSIVLLIFALIVGCQDKKESNIAKKKAIEITDETEFNEIFQNEKTIKLKSNKNFYLSAKPMLSFVDDNNDLIIVDNFNVRQILIFDSTGRAIDRIGKQGRGPGEYLYPLTIIKNGTHYFVPDGDLKRISVYDDSYQFVRSFSYPINLAKIIMSDDDRLYTFSDGYTGLGGNHIIYEINLDGKIKNSFMPQSSNYNKYVPSIGGGILFKNGKIYAITPYEYKLCCYSKDGEMIKQVEINSPNYYPPKQIKNMSQLLGDLKKKSEYHRSWSHIFYLLKFEDKIGIVYTEPRNKGKEIYLDLISYDLNNTFGSVVLPNGIISLYSKKNRLYILRQRKINQKDNHVPNPKIDIYELKK